MHIGRILPTILISLLMISVVATYVRISNVMASPGLLTGRIFDKGIDKDNSGLFDFMQIKVEVNITNAGTYYISVSGLKDGTGSTYQYASVYDSISTYLDAGIQNVSLSFYGPTIRASGVTNLAFVNQIYIYLQNYGTSESLSDLPLSRAYSYLEFDAAFTGMEATFKVFPNGTVDLAGIMNATHMSYPQKGLNLTESVDISTTGDLATVSASGNEYLPSWLTSQEPYKSSTVNMQTIYSKQTGILNLGLNATAVLPQMDQSQYPVLIYPFGFGITGYPMNSSDFSLTLAYSGGTLNGELDASSTLPPATTSAFPFNTTDFSLKADYRSGLLKGNVTFHILSGFPLGDLTLDFLATKTQANATGSVTVIYGTYPSYPNPITVNETYLDTLIANITQLEGTGPNSLYNMTNGFIEMDPISDITKTPTSSPEGAIVNFNFVLDGDIIGFIAYMYSNQATSQYKSGNITQQGVYRLLNATMNSVNSASLQLAYAHNSKTAVLKLFFTDDLGKLLPNLYTFPVDTTPLIIASGSMIPTLQVGDITLLKNVTDSSEINADLYNGDIIAFYRPNYTNEIIIHRATGKALVGDTWYFQTKGDNNYGPDYWSGPDTYNGSISEKLIIGKVIERIPWIGYAVLYSASLGTSDYNRITSVLKDFPVMIRDLLSSVKTFTLQLDYVSATRTFNLKLNLTFDALGYWSKIVPKIPSLIDSSMETLVEKLLAKIYAEIESANISFAYENGQAQHLAIITVKGDFGNEINYVKSLYVDEIMKSTSPNMQTPLLLMNATWLDAGNVQATFQITEDTEFFSLKGLRASPPIDPFDGNNFKLYRFFNFTNPTSGYTESPKSGEKLKLTVIGGNNGTRILTLIRPSTVPAPDYVSADETVMVWNNQKISSLRDLIFTLQYYTGIVYNGQTYPVITKSNGTVSPVTFDQPHTQLTLTINGLTGAKGFANISIPRNLMTSLYNSWTIIIGDRVIHYPDYQITEASTQVFLYFTFTFSSPVTIQIVGTIVVPEFPTSFLLVLIIATLTATTVGKTAWKIRRKPPSDIAH